VEEQLSTGAEGTERSQPVDPTGIPSLPPDVSAKEQEVRRLVDAGASSPEELRALAAKLQERRTYEDEVWRREVRPALMQSKKRRSKVVVPSEESRSDNLTSFGLAAALMAGMVLLLVIATQTSIVWLLLPVIGLLVYAWMHGRRGADAPSSED
jgi:hypothetical protein